MAEPLDPCNGSGPHRRFVIPMHGLRGFAVAFPADLTKEEFDLAVWSIQHFEPMMVARSGVRPEAEGRDGVPADDLAGGQPP